MDPSIDNQGCMSATAINNTSPTRTSNRSQRRTRHRYRPGPSMRDVAAGNATIRRGHSGEDVRSMQRALNAAGIRPPLDEDGLFGPKTQRALRQFQQREGMNVNGELGRDTHSRLSPHIAARPRPNDGYRPDAPNSPNAPNSPPERGSSRRAPHYDSRPPDNAVPAGQLRREVGADQPPRANGPAPVNAPRVDGTADSQLASLQRNAIGSARRELDAGVREDRGRPNRGERVDQYARNARMRVGGEWCGYFGQFNYSQAAQESGGRFRGLPMHSFQKARSAFTYRSYTNNSRSTNDRLDALQQRHQQEGSTRRFMTLDGSTGQRWASRRNRPHEVYQPNNLPVREGDTVLFNRGHVGMVEGYDQQSQTLTTIEGNVGNRVVRRTYDLSDPRVRARIEGFGRPALSDFRG